MKKRSVEDIRADFENAKRTGNIGEVESLQDELFCMRMGSRGGLVVNGENTSLQRQVTDLITEMDCYIADLREMEFDENLTNESYERGF
jgi:hypothetical protein